MLRHIWSRSLIGVSAVALAAATLGSPAVAAAKSAAVAPLAARQSTTVLTPAAAAAGTTHKITYDKYSLMIDGNRLVVWSGEVHPFRLPSPSLWRDVLQKLKANGYNAISVYFDWGYFSPKQGVYDFTGVRDMDQFLSIANEVGLYVIARPGPYINAEADAGGYPGWLINVAGKARTDAASYLAATDEWQTHIDGILSKHLLTNGTGTVILYQLENELASTGTAQQNYMQHLRNKAIADGINVPIFSNDKGRDGKWVPASSGVPGTVQGPVDLYAFDGYPAGSCSSNNTPGNPSAAPDWGIQSGGGADSGSQASPNTPGFAAEFGGGWFDYWGGRGSYPCVALRDGSGYEKEFYETNWANRLTIENFYMTFGGTSWGWLPAPVVYTSYDYGAALDEARQQRPKITTMKELGLFLQSVPGIAQVDKASAVTPSSSAVKIYHLTNASTGTHFYIAMHNPSNGTGNNSFTFPISTPDGNFTASSNLTGQDAKTFVADLNFGGQHLVYSTSEIETLLRQGTSDVAVLYGRTGTNGQTVLGGYTSAPTVAVAGGTATSSYSGGKLTLNYAHTGVTQVTITGGGKDTLHLVLASQEVADSMWRQDTSAGPVLERGPQLVRTASITGSTLALTGDTYSVSSLEIWAPSVVKSVTWNGSPISIRTTSVGTLAATTKLAAPPAISLPDLSKGSWRYTKESNEAATSFDDSGWATANHTTTTSTTPPPSGQKVLTADDYGFHHGDVWYRGRYTAGAGSVTIRYGGGGAGMAQAWLDGQYLGQNVLPTGVSSPATTGTATFTVPSGLRNNGPHVLAVMVRDDSHNEDGGVNDSFKEGRGLISASLASASGSALSTSITWKIQGNLGGETPNDTVRGPLNNGGLYGERNGYTLPHYPEPGWATRSVPDSNPPVAGTSWYRTSFSLNIPTTVDASLGLTIGDPNVIRSGGNYRVLIFLNGWNMGQYIANVGPQHTFVLPNGILDPHGSNTLALAVTSNGGSGDGLEKVSLTNLGTALGGAPLTLVNSPAYQAAAN